MTTGLEAYRAGVSERKRKSILKAAHNEFTTKGFHDAAMKEIAFEADVSTATLYKHCESKEGLYRMIIDQIHAEHGQAAVTAFVAESSFMFPNLDRSKPAPHLNAALKAIEIFVEDLKFEATPSEAA